MSNKKLVFQKFRGQHKLNEGVHLMNIPLYGQADYYYAICRQMLVVLFDKGLIISEQQEKIDELNRKTIFEKYPSIADLEVSA